MNLMWPPNKFKGCFISYQSLELRPFWNLFPKKTLKQYLLNLLKDYEKENLIILTKQLLTERFLLQNFRVWKTVETNYKCISIYGSNLCEFVSSWIYCQKIVIKFLIYTWIWIVIICNFSSLYKRVWFL